MPDIDRAIDAMQRLSLLAQLRDKVVVALSTDKRRCGNCYFWMKSSQCPYEKNVHGFSRGPSCDDAPCGKFKIEQRALDLKAERVAEAIVFAQRHSLPHPALTNGER